MESEIIYRYYNTKIFDYHNLKKHDINNLVKLIIRNRRRLNYPVKRSNKSYYREIIAHQRMYNLHLFRKHTIDCDLEEHIKLWKEIIYFIFSI